ncbi:gamma-tubulin complex component 3 homolog [Chrysoperla carnea]|uniref:gamma-tubulin complex component 3 homolog n=1 Tax=Chrysoperla carnea TaxID=189513 RepID=UPI001D06BB84|nr:gamma-tubulin complex component 3 homolog [Chrysoperla carnea]
MDGGVEIISVILEKICSVFTKDCPEHKDYIQRTAAKLMLEGLSVSTVPYVIPNELMIIDKVQKQIELLNTPDDGINFHTLLTKLDKLTIVKDRTAILRFLYAQSTEVNAVDNIEAKYTMGELHTINTKSKLDQHRKLDLHCNLEKIFPLEMKSSYCSLDSRKSSNVESLGVNSRNQLCCVKRTDSGSASSTEFKKDNFKNYHYNHNLYATEYELMQELIFALQGIESRVLRLDPSGGFHLDPKSDVTKSQKRIILRLTEVGYLHNRVKYFCDNAERQFGIMYQSLVSAFRNELTSFYKLIAILQEQLTTADKRLSLRRLLVWILEPQQRLMWLVSIGNAIQYKKGGNLISCVYGFLNHGAPPVQALVQHILSEVCRPLLNSISLWVLDGQIKDPCAEFFIEARPDITGDRLWHEKYQLREAMIPSFITREQAEKILATGKSIDFLREVCKEDPPRISPIIKKLFDESNVESLYMGSSALHAAIETVYKDTSRKVLDILLNKYNFMHHLYAIKSYLLLGQGDFIRHLMEMLMPELSCPASSLTPHNLSAILESAIRSTNAQYEDPDVLARIDVKIIPNSKQDNGWDVFSLIYHTNGPIGTIFVPCEDQYMALFHSLWNSKRMEFILSILWKNLTTTAKTYRSLPGMASIMQLMHILTAEMIHLVRQMQYYVLFEVLECNWEELTKKLSTADSLDDVIKAHNYFLNAVRTGALLNPESEDLSRQLRIIYSHIIQLQVFEERLCAQAHAELNAEREREQLIETQQGGFSLKARDETIRRERQERFQQNLVTMKGYLRILANGYQKHVRKFLSLLAEQPDMSLQLLSFRLDFNGHYKRLSRKARSTSNHSTTEKLEMIK